MKTVWTVVVLFALLLAGGFWFWSLGSLPAASTPIVSLVSMQGEVRVMEPGKNWTPATIGQRVIVGSTIQTSEGGEATVRFFDRAETRLAPSSTLVVTSAVNDPTKENLLVRLKLASGRAWSRVLQLADLESGFTIETSDAVATVRGTAFDAQKDGAATIFYALDGAVDVMRNQQAIPLPEGFQVRIATGAPHPDAIADSVAASGWVRKNQAADGAFEQGALERHREGLSVDADGGLRATLATWSEQWHSSRLPPSESTLLSSRYVSRRFLRWLSQAQHGESGSAFQSFSTFAQNVRASTGSDADQLRSATVLALSRTAWMFRDISPRDPGYRLKQGLEDLRTNLMTEPGDALFVRLLSVDDRLHEARTALDIKDRDVITNALDAASQGLDNIDRDILALPINYSTTRATSIMSKSRVLHAWLDALRSRAGNTTSTPVLPPVPPTATSTPAIPPTATTTVTCVSLLVTALPNPTTINTPTTIRVRGVRSDKTRVDLTTSTSLVVKGVDTTINKNVVTPSTVGDMSIEAQASCDGTPLTGSLTVHVNQPAPSVQSIAVTAKSPLLTFGGNTPLSVIAAYADGTTRDISNNAVFSLQDKAMGMMSGNVFTAGQTAGTAHINVSYTERGVTLSGSVTVNVVQ